MGNAQEDVQDAIASLVRARSVLSVAKPAEMQLLAEEIDDILRRLRAIPPEGDGGRG